MSLVLILTAIMLAAGSGAPGLLTDRRGERGERVAAAMMGAGAILGLIGAAFGFQAELSQTLSLGLPLGGSGVAIGIDALSAFFLVPIFLIGGLGPVYGLSYWRQREHATNGRKLRLFWGLLVAGMAMLVVARNALVFLFGWETMALSAFMLVATEDRKREAREASWIYLIATHFGTLFLFVMFGLLRSATGSFELRSVGADQAGLGLLSAIFFLALIGFGLKAGLMPLHFWLPSAHATAPSHVSAIMSGVLIKMGIYGLVRITSLLPDPPAAWGGALMILGAVSGLLGVVFAIGQHDLKRLLAYHSVENIGIIAMGLGLAMLGRTLGRADWIVLGLAGCLLHVWNHCLFKALLFLSAGSVVRAAGTRTIDRLGGLAKTMPWTAAMFLIGAVAICGLPPLNGFVSELMIYVGLFRGAGIGSGPTHLGATLAAPVLAMIGALAVACFVKAYGAVFLGTARGQDAQSGDRRRFGNTEPEPVPEIPMFLGAQSGDRHRFGNTEPEPVPVLREAPAAMIAPMAVLAACCVFIGLAPIVVAPVLDRAIGAWAPGAERMKLATLVPLGSIGAAGAALAMLTGLIALILRSRMKGQVLSRAVTWDCGYARPTARMQYTASSFAQMLVSLFRSVLRPREHRPAATGMFAAPSRFQSRVDEVVLDGQILPFGRAAERWLGRFRGLQQGMAQHYVLSILVTVIALLAWTLPIGGILARLFAR